MPEFYLVRHGEESFSSDRHEQLSLQGCEQALTLGKYFRHKKITFDRLVTGTLLQHTQCAQKICQGLQVDLPMEQLTGLNEFDIHSLVQRYLQIYPQYIPKDSDGRQAFFKLLKQAMLLWSQGLLPGELPESWQGFQQRVKSAIDDVVDHPSSFHTLVVTSGGPIAMTLFHELKLTHEQMIKLHFKISNTSVSQFVYNDSGTNLTRFNGTSHLDVTNRQENKLSGQLSDSSPLSTQ